MYVTKDDWIDIFEKKRPALEAGNNGVIVAIIMSMFL